MRAENVNAFLVLLLTIMSCDAVTGAPARYIPLQCLFRVSFFFISRATTSSSFSSSSSSPSSPSSVLIFKSV